MNNFKDKNDEELLKLMKKHAEKSKENEFASQLFSEDMKELGNRIPDHDLKVNSEGFKKYQDLYFSIHNFFLERGYYEEYGDDLVVKCLKKIDEIGVIVISFDDLDVPIEDMKDFLNIIKDADSMSASIFKRKISWQLYIHNVWTTEWKE